mgnify:CR=1 FL=1
MWQQLLSSTKDHFFQAVSTLASGSKRRSSALLSSSSNTTTTNTTTTTTTTTTTITTPVPWSDLYDLVLAFRWDDVIHHCQTNPQDARYQEGDNWETPLYLACQWNPPAEVIRALVQAYPEALLMTSREHRDLPLHFICRYKSTTAEVLQEMLQLNYNNNTGSNHNKAVVHPTKHGKTPLQILWNHARPDCLKEQRAPRNQLEQNDVDDFWNKVELLVKAVAKHRQQSWPTNGHSGGSILFLVHAVVSLGALGCPLEILEFICHKYPHQLQQRDKSGQLPLHLAVGPSLWSPSPKRKYKPREQEIIRVLLRLYPEAARERWFSLWDYYDTDTMMSSNIRGNAKTTNNHHNINKCIVIDRRGRFPLHMAVANRHTWEGGVQELFMAAPELLSVRDPVTKLYPFQLAAIPVGDTLVVNATTIWELLRLQPELLEVVVQ